LLVILLLWVLLLLLPSLLLLLRLLLLHGHTIAHTSIASPGDCLVPMRIVRLLPVRTHDCIIDRLSHT
jgi:hypothetical protein